VCVCVCVREWVDMNMSYRCVTRRKAEGCTGELTAVVIAACHTPPVTESCYSSDPILVWESGESGVYVCGWVSRDRVSGSSGDDDDGVLMRRKGSRLTACRVPIASAEERI
jgi:hypothetical protein